jgi:hypothetical protein
MLLLPLLLLVASASSASPKPTELKKPQPVATQHLKSIAAQPVLGFVLLPTFACPTGFIHCGQFTWTASADAAGNPTLAYNLYQGTTAGGESATPVNATPFGAGCSGATCTTIIGISAPGTYFWTLKATLNGAVSPPSNEVTGSVAPVSPVLGNPSLQ